MTEFEDDTPMTLDEACKVIFRGTISKASLRAEAARGNLTIERIGRRDFVTPRAIREMRRKCRVQPKDQGSTSGRIDESGSSAMVPLSLARDAAAMTVQALKNGSLNTSQKSTRQPGTSAR